MVFFERSSLKGNETTFFVVLSFTSSSNGFFSDSFCRLLLLTPRVCAMLLFSLSFTSPTKTAITCLSSWCVLLPFSSLSRRSSPLSEWRRPIFVWIDDCLHVRSISRVGPVVGTSSSLSSLLCSEGEDGTNFCGVRTGRRNFFDLSEYSC